MMGTLSASAKRSAEQKLRYKNSQTKTGEQKLVGTLRHWVMGTLSASAKRSVEQKLVETLRHWVTGTLSASAKRSVEQKLWNKNSGTKTAE